MKITSLYNVIIIILKALLGLLVGSSPSERILNMNIMYQFRGWGFGFLLNSGIEYAFIFVCICVDSYLL